MTLQSRFSKVQGIKRLIAHPATPEHERQAGVRALERLGDVNLERFELCWYCASAVGLKETDFMTFTMDGYCVLCGCTADVSEDWAQL